MQKQKVFGYLVEVYNRSNGKVPFDKLCANKKEVEEMVDSIIMGKKWHRSNFSIYVDSVDRDKERIRCFAIWDYDKKAKCFYSLSKQGIENWLNANGQDPAYDC